MYRIDESLMDADEVRGFLCARFDDQSVQALKPVAGDVGRWEKEKSGGSSGT